MKKRHIRIWKCSEVIFLKAHYRVDMTPAAIARALGRSLSSISNAAQRFGMTVAHPDWSAEEDAFIRAHYRIDMRGYEIAVSLGRTKHAVRVRARKIREAVAA